MIHVNIVKHNGVSGALVEISSENKIEFAQEMYGLLKAIERDTERMEVFSQVLSEVMKELENDKNYSSN